MEPSPEPPPPDPNQSEVPLCYPPLPPDIPISRNTFRPSFPEPDPITAVPENYLPDKEQLSTYAGQLRDGLETLVQGPLDYRLTSLPDSWNDTNLGIEQRNFVAVAQSVVAVLDAGPHTVEKNPTPLGAQDWGTLASACLAAIARGFTRPLKEVKRKAYMAYWESLEDNPQRKLDEGENPEFHSSLQRLKATVQHLDIHINADEADGMRKWTSTTRKEIERSAIRAASADIEIALHSWKLDQLTLRQQQIEESLKETLLERNVERLRNMASTLGLNLDDTGATPPPRPTPSTGNKRTISGSMPQPTRAAKPTPLPSVPDPPLQMPALDVVTLTAAVQTAMQPFMARLAAIESSAAAKNSTRAEILAPQHNQVQADKQVRPSAGQPVPTQPHPTAKQPQPEEEWVQVANKRRKRRSGKPNQADPTPQQINLTPQSYATVAATVAQAPTQPLAQNQRAHLINPPPPFTEVTVVRFGGSLDTRKEQATRIRQPDAIVREVKANMTRAVAKPLPIVAGRWSSGSRSKGNFVFTMRGQVDFAFIQTFEHFLTGPFPGGAQLCPNQGWTKLLAHGVPAKDNDDNIFGQEDLLYEVRTMEGLRSVYFSSPPRWLKPVGQISTNYTSLTFAFSDPDGSITKQLFKGKQALFGKQIELERWVDKPLLIQCERCHTLGHMASSKACRLPPDSIKCYICGKGHLADSHDRDCSRSKQHKVAGTCDCRVQCITCNKIGHHARDRACPAREGFRSRRTRPNNKAPPRIPSKDKGKGVDRRPPDLVSTQRPDPLGPAYAWVDDVPDEDMMEEDNNFIPPGFLPGPGLSREEAFRRMELGAEENLARLACQGAALPDHYALQRENETEHDNEYRRRTQMDRQKTPEEAKEAERYDLAEAVAMLPNGYFSPEMPETRQRQLAAIIAAGTPQIVDPNTPGIASTSTASYPC